MLDVRFTSNTNIYNLMSLKIMQKLSVTIITLNEEQNIRDALESVKWADEIVVVDSGSTDRTR